jgi:hypothetical protein
VTKGSVPVTAFARREWGTLSIAGPDRVDWLNGLLTCETKGLGAGSGCWGLLLNKQGKIQFEVQLVDDGAVTYASVPQPRVLELLDLLDRHLIMEDVELSDTSAGHGWVVLTGEGARQSVTSLPAVKAWGAVEWPPESVVLAVVPAPEEAALAAALRASGVALGDSAAWRRLRVEHELPEFGIDYGVGDNPHEAGLDTRAVSFTKGCYLGQEVVCMQDMRGKVKRRVTRLELEGDAVPEAGTAVFGDGKPVGEVTSAASVASGTVVALARLTRPWFEPGRRVEVGESAAVARPSV